MTIPRQRDHTAAVVEALADAGLTVGEAIAPAGGLPYVVVYPFGQPPPEGPVSDRYADVAPQVLVRAVGLTLASAEITADRARSVLLSTPLSVPGRTVTQVTLETSQPAARDDDVSPPLYYSTDVYGVWTTPST